MIYTSAPWEAKPETDYVPAQVFADGRELARVYGETRETRKGNARLMAAAPAMYEALVNVLEALQQGKEYQGEILEVIAQVREALRRASL